MSHPISNTDKWATKQDAATSFFFFINFEVFGNWMEYFLESLISFSNH